MALSRENLPFRKNTEGYFIDAKDNILAIDSGKGYLIFPGGGINDGETPTQGIVRETLEETGAIIEGELTSLGQLKIFWDKNWAKTDKQKKRYKKYQGDEMYFFFGKIKNFIEPTGDSESHSQNDIWDGQKLMSINNAIKFLEKNKIKTDKTKEYRNLQIKFLNLIKEKNYNT